LVNEIFVSDSVFEYVINIIDASRYPEKYWMKDLKKYITYWASPRAGLALLGGAKVNALLEWRSFVIPEDIKKLALKVLWHRIVLSYEAIADDIDEEYIVTEILKNVRVV
jgi:MoxR-like ATPase